METQKDGSTVFTVVEVKSLRKVIVACSNLFAQLPSSGQDLIGDTNYYALCMWEDVLNGDVHELSWYVDDEDDQGLARTVAEYLQRHGRRK